MLHYLISITGCLDARQQSDGTVELIFASGQIRAATPTEIASAQALIDKEENDQMQAKQYQKLVALKNMTPAEVQAWVDANVTTLAAARDAIKTLAVAVSILARSL